MNTYDLLIFLIYHINRSVNTWSKEVLWFVLTKYNITIITKIINYYLIFEQNTLFWVAY